MLMRRVEIKISPNADYRDYLKQFKEKFTDKWKNNKKSDPIDYDKFEKLQILGTGAFGTVRLVKYKPDNQYCAMKILLKSFIVKNKQVTHAITEKRILGAIEFPFVVSLEFSYKDNDCLYFGMPYCNGGEMFIHLRKFRKFTETQTRFYAAQVFLALEYLHTMGLVYRDLKPENILYDYRGYLRVTDFGFCKQLEGRTWTLCGTPEYIAPEIIQSKGYGASVDWWSYGVLLYEMSSGSSPFFNPNDDDPMEMYSRIIDGRYTMPGYFSDDLSDLIRNLLQNDVTRRFGNLKAGSDDIRKHGYFSTINWYGIFNKEVEPQFVPRTRGENDASNFEKIPETKTPRSKKCLYEKEFEEF